MERKIKGENEREGGEMEMSSSHINETIILEFRR